MEIEMVGVVFLLSYWFKIDLIVWKLDSFVHLIGRDYRLK